MIAILATLAAILFVAWLRGLVGVYTIGSIVHVLLVISIVLFVSGLLSGRRPLVRPCEEADPEPLRH